ncbi:MAG: hypothetical protein V2A71_05060 [Candidatus Eisenbacteria bacterium]
MKVRLPFMIVCLSFACALLLSPFLAASAWSESEGRTPAEKPAPSGVKAAAPPPPASAVTAWSGLSPQALVARFRAVAAYQADSIPHDYIALGDSRGYMHVLRKRGGGFSHSWSTFYLGSPVREIVADDIDRDGVVDLIPITSGGRMFIFDTNSRRLVWENTANDFANVSAIVIDQLDTDGARELVLCADSKLVIMDGERLLREHESADKFTADYMVVGDVDDDGEKEIVLNSGFVINARTLSVEWQTDFFGVRLTLVDVDGDGVAELVSESSGGALRIYDLDVRQEKTGY